MSVILNALRTKERASTANERIWPKEGLFIDRDATSQDSSNWRLSTLIIILFASSVFAVVRLSALYFASPSVAAVNAQVAQIKPLQPLALPKMDLATAKALFGQNRLDESLAAYETLAKTKPNDATLLNDMGFILMKQNRVLEAESRIQAAIKADSNCAECFNNMGMLATQMGRINEAEKYLNTAIEINDRYPDAHFNLGVLLEKAGDSKSAAMHFEEFLKWTPNKSAPVAEQVKNHLAKKNHLREPELPEL